MQGEERLSKTGRERGLWFGDAIFCAGHLRSVAGNEVEHSLCGVEFGDWWQHTTSVAGEEDDVGWVAIGNARDLSVVDVLNRVSAASVLSKSGIFVVDFSGHVVKHNILQD